MRTGACRPSAPGFEFRATASFPFPRTGTISRHSKGKRSRPSFLDTTHAIPCAPTREIQRMLVDMKDKQSSFVGSREWIGAIEIQMCLDKLYGVRMMWWWSWWSW